MAARFSSGPRKRGKRQKQRAQDDDAQAADAPIEASEEASAPKAGSGADAAIATEGGALPEFDPDNPTAVIIDAGDDVVTVDLSPQTQQVKESKNWDDNLAELLPEMTLGSIATDLLDAISDDERNRAEWLNQRAEGMELLGIKIERSRGSVGASSAPIDGMSTVRDPIMLEAILRGQANAYAELCPSEGPCKAVNYGAETDDADKLAEELEKDFNYYLTTTASEYYPDTRKMLGMTIYASGMFKKVYSCPLRRRPVSETVDGEFLIVPSNATDLKNAGRITHQIDMRQATMRRMQILGIYRDVQLTTPSPEPNAVQNKEADLAGLSISNLREEDQTYTVYECYCELDIPGFEHKKDGEVTGLPLPYRVTIDKDSQVILEIRRNWREDDEDFQAQIPFVAFPYVTGFGGFYGIGLLHIMGNVTLALTAMLREGIDAGMFANFPGGLIVKPASRQVNNEIRVAPGALAPIDIGAAASIRDAIMALPYKDITPGLFSMMQMMRDVGSRIGGTAETPVGEGKQDAPVGTTLAMIEQATKIEGGVHKSFHAAQAEELRLLKELFRDDPEALWRDNKRPALGPDQQVRLARFTQAINNCEIVPASDPNVPSHMHRLAKAQTLLQMSMGNPIFNPVEVARRFAAMAKIDDFDRLLAPPQQPQPDPMAMAALQLEAQKVQIQQGKLQLDAQKAQNQHQLDTQKVQFQQQNAQADRESTESIEAMRMASKSGSGGPQPPDPHKSAELDLKKQGLDLQGAKMVLDAHNAQADRQSRESVEAMKIAQTVGVHPEADQAVDQQLIDMKQFLTPASAGGGPPMSDGGAVPTPEAAQEHQRSEEERQRALYLAAQIVQALRERNANQGPLQ